MPRTDLLDELGLYLIERKNLMHRWTSLREILEAVKADVKHETTLRRLAESYADGIVATREPT